MSSDDPTDDLAAADRWLRETFSWYSVAKKEFRDAIRSRGVLMLSAVFLGFFLFPVLGQLYFGWSFAADLGMQTLISGLYLNIVTIFLPIVAIFVGYAAVTGERASGSLKLLLSLPFSRRDVIVGKVVGRSAVVGVPLLLAFLLTALLFVLSDLTFKPAMYGGFVLYTTGFTVVFVALAVSISGASPSNRFSGVANFLVYFYFTFLWNLLVNTAGDLLSEYVGLTGSIKWHLVLFSKLLNPSQAYKTLTNSMLSSAPNGPMVARFGMFNQNASAMSDICTNVLNGNASVRNLGVFGNRTVCGETAAGLPPYFSDPAVFVFLLLWIVVAAAISYYTFDQYDL